MDLLLIKLENVDNTFYESLLQFISEHGYTPKIAVRNTDIISAGDLQIISSKHQVFLGNKEVNLTRKEFYILELLARNKGQVLSKGQIYDQVWNEDYFSDDRNITAYINKIRKKIETDPSHPIYILTIWGVGYIVE